MAVVAIAILLAIYIVRDAVVRSSLPDDPALAAAAWPGHPDARIATGMIAIGQAAAVHRRIDATLTGPPIEVSRDAPLLAEPFMVRGVALQTEGLEGAALRAFQAAVLRAPWFVPAHVFLASEYARLGQAGSSLAELGRLLVLAPESAATLAPQIASSVKQAGGLPALRDLVSANPALRLDLLRALATDAANADLVLGLARPGERGEWQPALVQTLVRTGAFDRAFALWLTFNRPIRAPYNALNDPRFAQALAAPFGWSLNSGPAGVAEAAGGGALHLTYYGREEFVATSQTLLLPAGRYALATRLSTAQRGGSLAWVLSCLPAGAPIATVALDPARPEGTTRADFVVPPGCRAQQLSLRASPGEVERTGDFSLTNVALKPLR